MIMLMSLNSHVFLINDVMINCPIMEKVVSIVKNVENSGKLFLFFNIISYYHFTYVLLDDEVIGYCRIFVSPYKYNLLNCQY